MSKKKGAFDAAINNLLFSIDSHDRTDKSVCPECRELRAAIRVLRAAEKADVLEPQNVNPPSLHPSCTEALARAILAARRIAAKGKKA